MKNLTTPQAILFGLGLIALAIASAPYSSKIVKPALANNGVQKVQICDGRYNCAKVIHGYLGVVN